MLFIHCMSPWGVGRVPTHPRVTPCMRQAKGKGEPRTVPLTEACKFTNHIQCQCATENLSTKAFFFVLGGVVGARRMEKVKVKVNSLSRVRLFATPWTVAYQTPQSMGFSGKNTRVGCRFLLQGIFPTQGLNPCLLH